MAAISCSSRPAEAIQPLGKPLWVHPLPVTHNAKFICNFVPFCRIKLHRGEVNCFGGVGIIAITGRKKSSRSCDTSASPNLYKTWRNDEWSCNGIWVSQKVKFSTFHCDFVSFGSRASSCSGSSGDFICCIIQLSIIRLDVLLVFNEAKVALIQLKSVFRLHDKGHLSS